MANYCATSDVERHLSRYLKPVGGSFSDDTTPSKTEVDGLIADIYGEINATLSGAGVSPVPPTNATALAALRLYNALGAAALSASIMLGMGGEAAVKYAEQLQKQYEDRLSMIARGEGVAAVLLSASTTASVISNYTEGDFVENDDGTQKRSFTKGQVW